MMPITQERNKWIKKYTPTVISLKIFILNLVFVCFQFQYECKVQNLKKRKVAIHISVDGVKVSLKKKKRKVSTTKVALFFFFFIYVFYQWPTFSDYIQCVQFALLYKLALRLRSLTSIDRKSDFDLISSIFICLFVLTRFFLSLFSPLHLNSLVRV